MFKKEIRQFQKINLLKLQRYVLLRYVLLVTF